MSSRPALGSGWFTLGRVLAAVLTVAAVAYLANLGFSAWSWATFRRWADRPRLVDNARVDLYDDVVTMSATVLSMLNLVILVLFIVWLYQAHRSNRMDPALLQHKSGWAIGGWFVPFLNLVRPLQMVEDVDRGGQRPGADTAVIHYFWWGALIAGLVADRVTAGLLAGEVETQREALRSLARANLSDVAASAMFVAAAVLGVLVVRRVGRVVRSSPHHHSAPGTLGAGTTRI